MLHPVYSHSMKCDTCLDLSEAGLWQNLNISKKLQKVQCTRMQTCTLDGGQSQQFPHYIFGILLFFMILLEFPPFLCGRSIIFGLQRSKVPVPAIWEERWAKISLHASCQPLWHTKIRSSSTSFALLGKFWATSHQEAI